MEQQPDLDRLNNRLMMVESENFRLKEESRVAGLVEVR